MTSEEARSAEGQGADEAATVSTSGRNAPGTSRAVRLAVGVALVVVGVVAGGAVAVAVGGDSDGSGNPGDERPPNDSGDSGGQHAGGDVDDHAAGDPNDAADDDPPAGDRTSPRGDDRHRHERLAPYDQRYDQASTEQQAAADALLADVRATLQAYEDVEAAVAAGYQPPRRPHGPREHYRNPSVVREGAVDPTRPSGLIYYTGGDGDPVLLGAFYVAPPGSETPRPAGDLVVWHSHSPSCAGFFATEEAPCTDARRMLHVWTAERFEMVPRRSGQPVEVQVTDPFGAPFGAAVIPR